MVLTAAVAIFPSITYLCEMVCGGLWQGQKGRIMRNGLQKRVLRPLLHLRRGPLLAKSRTATRFPLQQQIAQSALCGCLYTGHDIATTFPYVYTSEGCSPRLLRSTATARVFRGAKIELRGLEVKKFELLSNFAISYGRTHRANF